MHTTSQHPNPHDLLAVEQRARQLRAEAFATGFSDLRRWFTGKRG